MRKIGEFLLAKDRNAAGVAFLCTLLPLIKLPGGFLASIVVGLITLTKGWRAGLMVLAWVALPAIALLFLRRFGVFDVLLLRCTLVWAFAIVLRKYASWQLVLEIAAVLGFIVILTMHLVIPDVKVWWTAHLAQYISEISKETTWSIPARETKLLIDRLVPIATGLMAFFIILGTFVQLLLARWWQSYLYNPGGLRKEFINIRMGYLAAIFAILIIVASLFHVNLAVDYLPVLILPFMIAGLSLSHLAVDKKKNLVFLLIIIYLGLFFLPFFVVTVLAVMGYVDAWVDMRRYIGSRIVDRG